MARSNYSQPYLQPIVGVILGVSAIVLYLLVELMVDGFFGVFDDRKMSRNTFPVSRGRIDQMRNESYQFGTIDKTEEIEAKIEQIREIWREGYNFKTKEIYKLEPLLIGLNLLNEFINQYWDNFSAEEKVRLVTQAGYLEAVTDPALYTNFKTFIRTIFSGKLPVLLKLWIKYWKHIYNNPRDHVFIHLNNLNKVIARSILELTEKDLEKVQTAVSLESYQALLKDYSSLEETTYLLRSPVNAQRLIRSLEQIKAGKGVRRELID